MEDVKLAEPETKIIITDPELSQYFGKEWIVTEEPICGRAFGPHDPEIVWVGPESGPDWPKPDTRVFLRPDQYILANLLAPNGGVD
jgi:hypothetical protein